LKFNCGTINIRNIKIDKVKLTGQFGGGGGYRGWDSFVLNCSGEF